jgi:hypothetical protein
MEVSLYFYTSCTHDNDFQHWKCKEFLKDVVLKISGIEEYTLLGCDAMKSSTSSPLFQRNVLPPSSGLKSKPSEKQQK